jgi:hypothetical protein
MDSVQNIPSGYDFDVWYNTYDPDFLDINMRSRVPQKWLNFQYVLLDHNSTEDIIKPINGYAKNFGVMPKLISIIDDVVTLRQYNHAEFYLLDKGSDIITRDRPWVRQYYKSKKDYAKPQGCFDGLYAFYMPWVIDSDIDVRIEQANEESPFVVFSQNVRMNTIDKTTRFLSSPLINFYFRSAGKHMIDSSYGRIKLGTPLFDIVFKADKDIVEKIRSFYEDH